MNTKVVLIVLLSLVLLLHLRPAVADVPSSTAHIITEGKLPIGGKDPLCTDKAHESCTINQKCCECKFPEYWKCYTCCVNN
ncbi:hypothetical protein LINPERPRIM_LOCUS32021 [Linum perenne]